MMADIVRWDPFSDLVTIQDQLNSLFGRTFTGSEMTRRSGAGTWMPALDVFETDDKLVAKMDLPGIDPKEVEVSVEDSTLTVSGRRDFTSEVNEENYHRIERRYGAFARSIALPTTADAEKVEASFDKGVLTIEIPKTEKARPKKIEVKARA
jgi:HSP20 family protein